MMGPGGGQPFGMPGLPPGLGGLVNAAAFQTMNMNAIQQAAAVRAMQAQQQQQQQQHQHHQQQQQVPGGANTKGQRTFVGVITKLHETYGFVDDDVFFQLSVVRGGPIHTGDRVMVEASYNPSMPFKWNAYRIQPVVDQQAMQRPGMPQGYGNVQAPVNGRAGQTAGRWAPQAAGSHSGSLSSQGPLADRGAYRPRSPLRHRRSPPRKASPPRRISPRRSPPRRISPVARRAPSPTRSLKRDRERSTDVSSSRRTSLSPPRRRARQNQRYSCSTPKPFIASSLVNASLIHSRYPNLYIPSDFCQLNVFWSKSFPLGVSLPMSATPVTFDVLHKDVEVPLPEGEELVLDSPDADCRYTVKVLLLAHQGLTTVQQRSFGLMPDGTVDENSDPVSITRILNFLVGVRGKNEVMAIGGAWSPSLDGVNPMDPQTQIKTAVRCTKAMIGVDLSSCSRWFKMVQLRYFRGSSSGSGGRIDNVTLLLPDTSSTGSRLQPSAEEYAATRALLQEQLRLRLEAIDAEEFVEASDSSTAQENTQTSTATASSSATSLPAPTSASTTDGDATVTTSEPQQQGGEQKNPTHFSLLVNDLLSLEIDAVKSELEARKASIEGEEEELRNKLKELLDKEAASHEEERAAKKAKFEENKAQRKSALERHFVLPENPTVLVYPSKTAKGGKLECKTVSLQSMLDYRSDDNKEASFEVFLFAEAIKELLDRDFAFTIYRSLIAANDKDEESKKKDEALEVAPAEGATPEDKEKKEQEKTKFKAIVGSRALFTAYAHFDSNSVGYLQERDVDEIVQSIGIDVSRADIHRLTKKVLTTSSPSSRDRMISYRNLTDHFVDADGVVKYAPTQLPVPSDDDLALGHHVGEAAEQAAAAQQGETPDVTATGVVQYKGVLVNLAENMDQLQRVETERNAAIAKTDELDFQLKNVKERRDYLEKKKKRLEDDVDRYRKRMHEAEKNFKKSQDNESELKKTLLDCRRMADRVVCAVDKAIPREKPAKKEESVAPGASQEKSVEKKDDGEKESKQENGEDHSEANPTSEQQVPELVIANEDEEVAQEGEEMNIMEVDAVGEGVEEQMLQIDDENIVLAEEVGAED